MSEVMIAVKPQKLKMFGMPSWFHPHGTKIKCIGFDDASAPTRIMLLEANAVKIKIYSYAGHGYIVEYTITQSPDSQNTGKVWMSKENLGAAFGFSDTCKAFSGQWLANEYGADVASQGKYIRYGKFLNIPGPGTGHDGDANVSILIDEIIQEYFTEIFFK